MVVVIRSTRAGVEVDSLSRGWTFEHLEPD